MYIVIRICAEISEIEAMNLKGRRKRYIRGLRGRRRKEETFN